MITFIVIVSILSIFFLPIVGIILGFMVALNNKSDWEENNKDANIIDGR